MTFGIVAPVGDSISLRQLTAPSTLLSGQLTSYFQSGTAALAAAIKLVKDRRALTKPNIIIPAYCCPDLVAACLYVGVEVRAADTQLAAPFYCAESLDAMVDQNTMAIICVNVCGLHEQVEQIRQQLDTLGSKAIIIEDWAQYHPATANARAPIHGIAIRSFGKGKPASMLTGGAIIFSPQFKQQTEISWRGFQFSAPAASKLKVLAFNAVLTPEIYAMAIHSGVIRPGLTQYHGLESITRHRAEQFEFLAANIAEWQAGPTKAQSALIGPIEHAPELRTIAPISDYRGNRLLRIPLVLANQNARDSLLAQGSKLGMSAMYQRPITAIAGLPAGAIARHQCKNAEDLAGRFITLPCHSRLRDTHINALQQLISGATAHD